MNSIEHITTKPLRLTVAITYPLLAAILLAPTFLYPRWLTGYQDIYNRLGADLPDITRLVFNLQPYSASLFLLVIAAAGWFKSGTRRGHPRVASFVLLNLTLLACIAWRELAVYAYQLPALQLLRMQ